MDNVNYYVDTLMAEIAGSDAGAHDNLLDVGGRIHFIREQKAMSLRKLAQLSGLSVNAISRIERGETSPTVSTLRMLATALEVPITEFFSQEKKLVTVFVKEEHRLRSGANGFMMESLGIGLENQILEPFLIRLHPNGATTPDPVTHSGQEFALCVEGRIDFQVAGTTYVLEPGDSLLFEASQPHCFLNRSDETATMVVVFASSEQNHVARRRHMNAVTSAQENGSERV